MTRRVIGAFGFLILIASAPARAETDGILYQPPSTGLEITLLPALELREPAASVLSAGEIDAIHERPARDGNHQITIYVKPSAAKDVGERTRKAVGRMAALYRDGTLLVSPRINEPLSGALMFQLDAPKRDILVKGLERDTKRSAKELERGSSDARAETVKRSGTVLDKAMYGDYLSRNGRAAEAVELVEPLIAKAGKDDLGVIVMVLENAYKELGRPRKDLIPLYRSAIEKSERGWGFRESLASIYAEQGSFKEAYQELRAYTDNVTKLAHAAEYRRQADHLQANPSSVSPGVSDSEVQETIRSLRAQAKTIEDELAR